MNNVQSIYNVTSLKTSYFIANTSILSKNLKLSPPPIPFAAPSQTGKSPVPPRTDCGGIVISAGGAITMLNMTSSGEVWYDCVWLVRARLPAGHAGKLSLRLKVFRDFCE